MPKHNVISESAPALTGTVKWFNAIKGYGFIIPDNDTGDVFLHVNQLRKSGIDELLENSRVRFSIEEFKGRFQAVNLEII